MHLALLILAVCVAGCSEPAPPEPAEERLMTSPMIQDAEVIAGEWRLELSDGQSCALRLVNRPQPVESGSLAAEMLGVEADCAAAPGVAGWRPAPLGLDLADARGMTLFSFEQVGPEAYLSSATGARLSRR